MSRVPDRRGGRGEPTVAQSRSKTAVLVVGAIVLGVGLGLVIRAVRQEPSAPSAVQDPGAFEAARPVITDYFQRPVRAAGDRLPENLSPPRCDETYLGSSPSPGGGTAWYLWVRCESFERDDAGGLHVRSSTSFPVVVSTRGSGQDLSIAGADQPVVGDEFVADVHQLFPQAISERILSERDGLAPSDALIRTHAEDFFTARDAAASSPAP